MGEAAALMRRGFGVGLPFGGAPVIVVGGGPTGLTAALELMHHGVPSIVLETGRQRCDGSRAIAVHRTALAVWERLGCAEPMLTNGIAWRARRTFCGERELHAQLMPAPARGDLLTFLNLPQYRTEDYLIRAVQSTQLISPALGTPGGGPGPG